MDGGSEAAGVGDFGGIDGVDEEIIVVEGGNKGAALTRLVGSLGIALRQTAVAGDSENDLSMFAVAGLTYAMGNAVDSLRARADRIAPTNDEEGVAWVLRDIMERNRER